MLQFKTSLPFAAFKQNKTATVSVRKSCSQAVRLFKVQVVHFPNIFRTMKRRNAPPRPPPQRRYNNDQPAAANIGAIIIVKSIIFFKS